MNPRISTSPNRSLLHARGVPREDPAAALAGRNITLLTYDTGQSTRARNAGLQVKKLASPRPYDLRHSGVTLALNVGVPASTGDSASPSPNAQAAA